LLEESYENTHLNVTVEDDCNEYGRPMATIITFDDGAWSCTVRLRDELTNTSTEPTNDDGYDHDPHTEGMEVFVTPTKAIEIVANAPDPHRTYLRDYHALVTLLRQLA
jgi:hypothetical protein